MELTYSLVQVFDILGHGRGGDGLPCLFDDQGLSSLLDTHLLQEYVHDDEHHNGEEHRVILDLVNLEDDELLVKERIIHVVVQRVFQFTAPVELFEDGREVVDVKRNFLFRHDLRNAFQSKLVIGIERQSRHLHLSALCLHLVNLLLDADEVFVLNQFRHQAHKLVIGSPFLTIRSSLILDERMQFLYLATYLFMVFLLLFVERQFAIFGFSVHLQLVDTIVITVFLLQLLLVFLVLAVLLVLQKQSLAQFASFVCRVLFKGMEILLVVFHDGLVDDFVLNFRRFLISLEDEEYQ